GADCFAQGSWTIPPGLVQQEAPSTGEIAGLATPMRQQFIVSAAHLQGLVGRQIDAIWLRRDPGYAGALDGGVADLAVTLSMTDTAPESPSEVFDTNHGTGKSIVFRGRIVVPASQAPGTDLWAVDQTIRLTFAVPFAYAG